MEHLPEVFYVCVRTQDATHNTRDTLEFLSIVPSYEFQFYHQATHLCMANAMGQQIKDWGSNADIATYQAYGLWSHIIPHPYIRDLLKK